MYPAHSIGGALEKPEAPLPHIRGIRSYLMIVAFKFTERLRVIHCGRRIARKSRLWLYTRERRHFVTQINLSAWLALPGSRGACKWPGTA
jgi:hypothetical protein